MEDIAKLKSTVNKKRIVSFLISAVFFSYGLLLSNSASAEELTKKFSQVASNGDKLIEYIDKDETFDHWTKLIGYRYQHFKKLDNDPIKYASLVGMSIKKKDSNVPVKVIRNSKAKEAALLFYVWSNSKKFVELNIWRFKKSIDQHAIVSVQMAQRVYPKDFKSSKQFGQTVKNNMNELGKKISKVSFSSVEEELALIKQVN